MRAFVALAAAGLLGVGVPAWMAVEGTAGGGSDAVAELDEAMAPWRGQLARPGARIHLGLDEDPRRSSAASARLFVTAYALAPAVVVPVVLAGCAPGQPADCGLGGATRLVLCGPAADQAPALAVRFGLTDAVPSGPCLLLRRPAR